MKQCHSIIKVALVILFSAFLSMVAVKASAESEDNLSKFSQAELAQVLAPIALYPDTLLTHILIAATYPLEVIAAERWLTEHHELSTKKLMQIAENKDWDASVKALLGFPRVLKNLSTDIVWMQNVGDAFLQDEAEVLRNIQVLRKQADEAGNLAQMDNVEIVRQAKTIIIQSSQPDIIYVPYYDSRVVYGKWHWSHYQPVYWHRPIHFSYHRGPFYWHSGVHIAFDFFFNAFHWNAHHVVVHHHNHRNYYHNPYRYHNRHRVTTSYQGKRWQHNPHHRKGVSYRSENIRKKYRSVRPIKAHTRIAKVNHQINKYGHKPAVQNFRSDKYRRVNEVIKANKSIKYKQSQQKLKNSRGSVQKPQLPVIKAPYADKKWQQQKPRVIQQKTSVIKKRKVEVKTAPNRQIKANNNREKLSRVNTVPQPTQYKSYSTKQKTAVKSYAHNKSSSKIRHARGDKTIRR